MAGGSVAFISYVESNSLFLPGSLLPSYRHITNVPAEVDFVLSILGMRLKNKLFLVNESDFSLRKIVIPNFLC